MSDIPAGGLCFNDYQREALLTDQQTRLDYYMLEILNEAGEAASHVKKHCYRDKPLDREALALELGDVLWPLAVLCHKIGYSLETVARMNLEKLANRHALTHCSCVHAPEQHALEGCGLLPPCSCKVPPVRRVG